MWANGDLGVKCASIDLGCSVPSCRAKCWYIKFVYRKVLACVYMLQVWDLGMIPTKINPRDGDQN